MARHDTIRDALHAWLQQQGIQALKEQRVPAWDQPEERAVLDIAYTDPEQGHMYVDATVVAAVTHQAVVTGVLLARREQANTYVTEGTG